MSARNTPNPKVLLLVTDGQPNCPEGGGNGDDVDPAIAAVGASFANNVPVFVVGIATTGGEAHETLNAMATAGGYPRKDAMSMAPLDPAYLS